MNEESGVDAVENHFGGKAEGFSNPNAEPKEKSEEIKPEDLVDMKDVNSDDEEDVSDLSYTQRLAKLKISNEDAQAVIDDICEKGSFLKKYVVRKARDTKPEIKVVFITRDTRTQGFIAEQAATLHKNIPILYNKIMGEMQMAASIVHYNGEDFTDISKVEDVEEFGKEMFKRVALFSKLPAPITVVISRRMVEFDLMVAASMSPGYEDFF